MYAPKFKKQQDARYLKAFGCDRNELIAHIPSFQEINFAVESSFDSGKTATGENIRRNPRNTPGVDIHTVAAESPFYRYLAYYGFKGLLQNISTVNASGDSDEAPRLSAGFIEVENNVRRRSHKGAGALQVANEPRKEAMRKLFILRLTHTKVKNGKRKLAIVSHGLFDHLGIYKHLIEVLYQLGFDVIAFDYRGFGLSEGEATHCQGFDDYVEDLTIVEREVAGQPIDLYAGQSTGCAIISLLLDKRVRESPARKSRAKQSLKAQADGSAHDGPTNEGQCEMRKPSLSNPKFLFFAPLAQPRGFRSIRTSHYFLNRFIQWFPRTFRNNSSDLFFVAFLRDDDPLQSLALRVSWISSLIRWVTALKQLSPKDMKGLIVLGKQDRTIDLKSVRANYSRIYPYAEWLTIAGAGHQLVNESADKRNLVQERLIQFLAIDEASR